MKILTKEVKTRIKRAIAFNSLKFFGAIIRVLPKPAVYALAASAAKVGFFIAVRHRRTAYESLNIAFGNKKNKQEITKIIKDCFVGMAKGILEMLAFFSKPQLLDKMVSVEGRDNLDEALSKGKGVIMVSGHFGNFPLLLTKLVILGYKVNLVLRRMRDGRADEYFNKRRSIVGIKSIYTQPRTECVKNIITALRNNEIVFMLMDQNFGSGAGVFVDFFGRKAATATGPVVFALRTDAEIVPAFIFRKADNMHQLTIEPRIVLGTQADADKDKIIFDNVAKITGIIERYVRAHPAEWGWIHRRWKSQPNPASLGHPDTL
ncbi:MAG: lysophospholipid acyltransferase family protein [Candidatus Omnitrophota bacterium]|nr:lysophospholipid acyltransferase family protein [Candidatus Omnitrophota bacterium]